MVSSADILQMVSAVMIGGNCSQVSLLRRPLWLRILSACRARARKKDGLPSACSVLGHDECSPCYSENDEMMESLDCQSRQELENSNRWKAIKMDLRLRTGLYVLYCDLSAECLANFDGNFREEQIFRRRLEAGFLRRKQSELIEMTLETVYARHRLFFCCTCSEWEPQRVNIILRSS